MNQRLLLPLCPRKAVSQVPYALYTISSHLSELRDVVVPENKFTCTVKNAESSLCPAVLPVRIMHFIDSIDVL